MASPVIELRNVSKTFVVDHMSGRGLRQRVFEALGRSQKRSYQEQFQALTGVSFSAARGDAVAVLGHNGSGKSTLLQLVAGIYMPTSGSVCVAGRIAALIELGVGFHFELSGIENIFLNASLYGMTNEQTKAKFDDIVRFSGLESFIDSPIKTYSSGMIVRLGFSVAVHTDPEILLADEILAVGDEQFKKQCFERIRSMQDAGLTLLFVTHDADDARKFCRRYIRLEHGRLIEDGALSP